MPKPPKSGSSPKNDRSLQSGSSSKSSSLASPNALASGGSDGTEAAEPIPTSFKEMYHLLKKSVEDIQQLQKVSVSTNSKLLKMQRSHAADAKVLSSHIF